jgi:hypothetical protein
MKRCHTEVGLAQAGPVLGRAETERLEHRIKRLCRPSEIELGKANARMADEFRAADVSAVPETVKGGRPQNHQQNTLASYIIDAYEKMTNSRTSISGRSPGLVRLARSIFELTGLTGDARAALAAVQKERSAKRVGRKHP